MRKIAILLTVLGGFLSAYGQQEIRNEISKEFTEFAVNNLQEKLFLHTDKEVYAQGETVWLKAYVVDATFHKPLGLSKVFYVELLDEGKKALVQEKIELKEGSGHGSITIPGLATGEYYIRAYTRWMRNYETAFFYQKKITILGLDASLPKTAGGRKSEQEDPAIQFFPEGGNLVTGIESKIAFKISDKYGNGLDSHGIIVNQSADTIVSFRTHKFGIGNLIFTPHLGENYRVIFNQDLKQYTATLPTVHEAGYVMKVTAEEDFLKVQVSYSGTRSDDQNIFLIAHTRQFPYAVQHAVLNNKTCVFQIARKDLMDGITALTILSDAKIPVAERLYFTPPRKKLEIKTLLTKNVYATRDEVALTVSTSVNSMSTNTNVSVSVFKIDSLQDSAPFNFENYLLLTSDLKGKIEAPEYYLNQVNQDALAIDNLMLTHGWRRFTWDSVLKKNSRLPRFAPESEGLIVSGQIKNVSGLQSVEGQQLLLSLYGGMPNVFAAQTNSSGRFEFYVRNALRDGNMVIANRKNVYVNYMLDNAFEDSVLLDDNLSQFNLSTSLNSIRERLIHAQVMGQLSESEKFRKSANDESAFYGEPLATYQMADYVEFPTVEDVLREYVPEVIVRTNTEKRLKMFMLDKDKSVFFEQEPLLLVDGVPMVSSHRIIKASAKNLERVEVFPKKYFHGPFEFSGVINLKTINQDLAGFDLDSTSFVFALDGLQNEREFYSPAYSTTDEKSSRLPDFRHVLYWNPEVNVSNGEQILRFYTGDQTGKFRAVIHGLTKEGIAATKTFTFEVIEHPR